VSRLSRQCEILHISTNLYASTACYGDSFYCILLGMWSGFICHLSVVRLWPLVNADMSLFLLALLEIVNRYRKATFSSALMQLNVFTCSHHNPYTHKPVQYCSFTCFLHTVLLLGDLHVPLFCHACYKYDAFQLTPYSECQLEPCSRGKKMKSYWL
jgi:hypothetical protein